MTRRYLDVSEVRFALQRGKAVECFLGACSRNELPGIRWLLLRSQSNGVEVSLFETADLGSEEFLDLYEFGPLDPSLELDKATEEMQFTDLDACLSTLSERFPGSASRLVNEGVVQDEYADFISRGRKNA
jgi:hypothetical protein